MWKILDSIANAEQGSATLQFAYVKGPLGTYAGWRKGGQGDEWRGQNEVQCQLEQDNRRILEVESQDWVRE